MKKIILSVVLMTAIAGMASAQNMRLNAYSAYVFDDNVDSRYDNSNYYNGTIKGGYQFGAGLEFMVDKSKGIEIKYLHQNATAPMVYSNGGLVAKNKNFKLGISYILLGGSNYFKTAGGKVEPYLGAGLGMAVINIKNPEQNGATSKTKFAWEIKGGTNIWFSDKVGLKLNLELMSAVQSVGGGLFFGTGGASAGVATYSTMLQFAMGGGLVFKMGK
jgi:outer membrane protein W